MNTPDPYATPETDSNFQPPNENPKDLKELMFSFKGRISRTEFWKAFGIMFVALIAAGIIAAILSMAAEILSAIVMLLVYIPAIWCSLAMQAKRWHDRDKSAWWICIGFIPIIGGIWAFVETGFLKGTEGPNKYGVDPVK